MANDERIEKLDTEIAKLKEEYDEVARKATAPTTPERTAQDSALRRIGMRVQALEAERKSLS